MTLDVRSLARNMVANTMKILSHEDAILKVNPERWEVYSLRTPSRRVRVRRVGDQFRCSSDKRNSQDQPCSHILAVLIYEGLAITPNTAADVYRKGNEARDHGLEEAAWKLVPTKLPELLGRLLREGLPVMVEPPVINPKGGRPPASTFGLLYQSIMRVAWRNNLRASQGLMASADHRQHNPYGGFSRSTMSKFLVDSETTTLLEKLLALTTWPAKPYETLVHPDGTGLTEQHFTAFFEEKHHKRPERREHRWNYAEFLWTYEYTMIAALYAQPGPFGEAPWLLPLLERASIMLDLRELGADKAYNAYYIYEYARRHGIEPQIKLKANAAPSRQTGARAKAYRAYVHQSRIDPEGYAARANRRSNAETGNRAFKAFLGDQIYSSNPTAQRNEILCMAIAYNLTRLVVLSVEHGIEINFVGGAQSLADSTWVDLGTLYHSMTVAAGRTRHLGEANAT
ncbi:MAG: transposase [bacterium]